MEWTLNKSQHRKLTLEKKIFLLFLLATQTRNLSIRSPMLYQQAILAPTNISGINIHTTPTSLTIIYNCILAIKEQ